MIPVHRGDLVTVALSGDFGKPRPAVVIQSDLFDETQTVTVLLVSTTILESPVFRVTILPTSTNALVKPSQIMVDKAMTVRRDKVGKVFGRVDGEIMVSVERSLAVFFGLA